jgi:hypothetical protein
MGTTMVEGNGMDSEAATATYLAGLNFDEMDYRTARAACFLTPAGIAMTPDWLMDTAAHADQRYKALSVLYPPGTMHTERNLMRDLSEAAMEVAAWMESQQVKSLAFAGPFGPDLPLKGERVRINKGSVVYSTNPKAEKGTVILQRDQTVQLRSADRGYINESARTDRGEARVVGSTVRWSGASGYWRWTDASNVMRLSD